VRTGRESVPGRGYLLSVLICQMSLHLGIARTRLSSLFAVPQRLRSQWEIMIG